MPSTLKQARREGKMSTLSVNIIDSIRILVDAAHPQWFGGVFTVSLVLKDQEREEEVFLNLVFERNTRETKVLSSNLSEFPVSPTRINLWGLEAEHNYDWATGVEKAINRAVAWLDSRANGGLDPKEVEVEFSTFNLPAVHRDALVGIHSDNIYQVQFK